MSATKVSTTRVAVRAATKLWTRLEASDRPALVDVSRRLSAAFSAFQREMAQSRRASPTPTLTPPELAHRGRSNLESGRIARLTARELEVLGLVAQGMSNNEVAQELVISPKTASVHVSRILTKLGVNSRAKATVIAYEERILAASGAE